MFENKIHHTTFFGNNPEFIHGIHMLPISPITAYIKSKEFVSQEWNKWFDGYRTKSDDWTSVLNANLALWSPKTAFEFFAGDGFEEKWLQQGESRAWYLFYSAALAGMWS
jgi:endo-1,3(4)-beta-glucanase